MHFTKWLPTPELGHCLATFLPQSQISSHFQEVALLEPQMKHLVLNAKMVKKISYSVHPHILKPKMFFCKLVATFTQM